MRQRERERERDERERERRSTTLEEQQPVCEASAKLRQTEKLENLISCSAESDSRPIQHSDLPHSQLTH